MHVRRTVAPLAALLAVLIAASGLLSACGGGGSSVADPPVSGSPSSTAPTTQPPARESPQHFIRRWAAAEKRMENTGETGPYLAMSRGCVACRQLADDIGRFYSHGGYAEWGGWKILAISREDRKGYVFDVKVDSLPTSYKESADGPMKHLPGGLATHQLTIRSAGTSWHVTQKARLTG